MYKPLAGFITRILDGIDFKARYLPLSDDDNILLTQLLPDDGDYSFVELREGRAVEVVKLRNYCGHYVIDRGAEQTTPINFHCNAGVSFTLTMQGVKDTICQMQSCDS